MAHRGPGIRPPFEHTRQTLIRNLLAIIRTPTPIAAVNAAEGWSRDGTVDIADAGFRGGVLGIGKALKATGTPYY
jgi:hypothetical protein